MEAKNQQIMHFYCRKAKTVVLLQKPWFTAFLSRMSRKTQHTRFEDKILRKFANEDKPQVVEAWCLLKDKGTKDKKQNIKRIADQFNFLLCGRRESRACSGRLQCESDLPRTGNETSTERQSDRQFAGQAMKFWAILRLTGNKIEWIQCSSKLYWENFVLAAAEKSRREGGKYWNMKRQQNCD